MKTAYWAILLASLTSLATACSSPSRTPRLQPTADLAGATSVAVAQQATFASLGSGPLLAAAMEYPPVEIAEPAPPVSLTASDGTGLRLVSLRARAVIEGPLAFTEVQLSFENPRDRVIEGRFAITLPPGASISRLAMRLDHGWQEAEVVERQAARRAYEDFLHRRQDPALLEKEAGNEFRARIFPIPARGRKDIIVSYSQVLSGNRTYTLPLRGLPEIEQLEVTAMVGQGAAAGRAQQYQAVRLARRRQAPDRDFEAAPAADGGRGLVAPGYAVVRLRPAVDAEPTPIAGAVILFDTSASRALGFAADVERLGSLVRALAQAHGDMQLAVAAFDQGVAPLYQGKARDFGKPQLDAILARRPLGASNLGAALSWAASAARGYDRLIVISDAIATAGATDGDALLAQAKKLAPAFRRMDVVLAGGIRDDEIAGRLVRGNLSRDGLVLDASEPAAVLAERLSRTTVSGIEVAVPGAHWVWPETIDGVQPGDDVVVFAGLKQDVAAGGALKVSLSGPVTETHEIPMSAATRPLLERAAVRARIAQLTDQRDRLPSERAADRKRLIDEIVRLSVSYRVLSDYTALLVLETEDDYARFGIDRKALVDIMTVGSRGVDLVSRAAPVLIIAEPPPTTPTPTTGRRPPANEPTVADPKPVDAPASRDARDDDDDDDEADKRAYKTEEDGADAAEDEEHFEVSGSAAGDEVEGVEGGVEGGVVGGVVGGVAGGVLGGAEAPPPPPSPPTNRPVPQPPARPTVIPEAPRPEPEPTRQQDWEQRRRREDRRAAEPLAPGPDDASVSLNGGSSTENAYVIPKPEGPPPLAGKPAEIAALLAAGKPDDALLRAMAWRKDEPGDVMALIALGETLEARGQRALASRAYGSIIDLFPSRADLRRFAGQRLERLGDVASALVSDTFAAAVAQRPDHLTGHRLLAYALLRAGDHAAAFDAALAGLAREYPDGRFSGGKRILREDLGLIAAAWLAREPARRSEIERKLASAGAELATRPSLRFVLYWETDANDVDFHIWDGKGGHAYYSDKQLASGGALYEDITTGYGPECFTIEGTPSAYPYTLRIHYYSRGPMGYGMGKLEVVRHDGHGGLQFEQRPFIVMNDQAYVELGTVTAPGTQQVAR